MPEHILTALAEVGVAEIPGRQHHPRILQYMSEAGFSFIDDETAWCSIFVNWVCKKHDLPQSHSALARSWLHIGEPVENFQLGDLAVFWRKELNSPWGHVGFPISQHGNTIYVLGGNQNNQVRISVYPKQRLLGYRRLVVDSPAK